MKNEYDFCTALDRLLDLPQDFIFDENKRRGKKQGSFPYHDIAGASFIIKTLEILNENLFLNKTKKSELDFSDLIKIMHSAVSSSAKNAALRREVGRKYQIIMIDEFQDTDNLQWEIFSSLFKDSDRKIVLIGDPKQSIYRFRGADIEVYFRALEEIKEKSIKYMLGKTTDLKNGWLRRLILFLRMSLLLHQGEVILLIFLLLILLKIRMFF